MTEANDFLLAFHRRHPGCTRIAFEAGQSLETGASSYELLSCLADNDRVLDLGCGDGPLLSLLSKRSGGNTAVGLDLSPDELRTGLARSPSSLLVRARAEALPFASQSFSLVLSHFAFHLMSNLETLVDELGRILIPGGRFATIIGGGPKVGDAFEVFLDLLVSGQRDDQKVPSIGERQGRTNDGLRSLFADNPNFGEAISIEDFYIDFGGTFEETWTRLSTVYDLYYYSDDELMELRERFRSKLGDSAEARIPCTMAIRRVMARRTSDLG